MALLGPVLGALDQASIVGHDFVLWQMKCKFQGHQHWELKGNQFSPVQSELLFQFLQSQQNQFSFAFNNLGLFFFFFQVQLFYYQVSEYLSRMHLLSIAMTDHQRLGEF